MSLSFRQQKNNPLSQAVNFTPHKWRQCRAASVPTSLNLYKNVDIAASKTSMLMQKLPCGSREGLETLFLTFQGLPVRWGCRPAYTTESNIFLLNDTSLK